MGKVLTGDWKHLEQAVKPTLADMAENGTMIAIQAVKNADGIVELKTAMINGHGDTAPVEMNVDQFVDDAMEYAFNVLKTPDDFEKFCEFIENEQFVYSSETINRRLERFATKTTERKILNKIFCLRADEVVK